MSAARRPYDQNGAITKVLHRSQVMTTRKQPNRWKFVDQPVNLTKFEARSTEELQEMYAAIVKLLEARGKLAAEEAKEAAKREELRRIRLCQA
jgi:hypothetical protein